MTRSLRPLPVNMSALAGKSCIFYIVSCALLIIRGLRALVNARELRNLSVIYDQYGVNPVIFLSARHDLCACILPACIRSPHLYPDPQNFLDYDDSCSPCSLFSGGARWPISQGTEPPIGSNSTSNARHGCLTLIMPSSKPFTNLPPAVISTQLSAERDYTNSRLFCSYFAMVPIPTVTVLHGRVDSRSL